jgi:transposase-like protein
MEAPKTLQEAILHFSDFENCKGFMISLRWPDGAVKCPRCGSGYVVWIEKERVWKCYGKHDHAKFSLKTGTIMEDSAISIDKWLAALWMVVNCKNGISSCEIARHLGVTQKSAWFMDHRIRMALYSGSIEKMSGHVEADETFIGGKARKMHPAQRQRRITGTGSKTKLLSWASLSMPKTVRAGYEPACLRIARRKPFRPKYASTSKQDRRSTLTFFCPRWAGW